MTSKRGKDWNDFAAEVFDHVENYTVPQYGDAPDDQLESFTIEDIQVQLRRYVNRMGRNMRGKEEALRDMMKIAHYAQVAHLKMKKD